MTMKAIPFLTLCSLLLRIHLLVAQCCSPGNPIGGAMNLGINPQGSAQLFFGWRYGYAGHYFDGNNPVEGSFVTQGDYMHLSLTGTYGLTDRLTIETETGYVLYKRQFYAAGIQPNQQSGSGLTDLSLLARINLLRKETTGWELTGGLGVKFPLGSYRQSQDGIRLPRDLQPSTGSVDLVQTWFLQKAFLPQKFRLFFLSRFEWKGANPESYRYGAFLAASGFASYSPTLRWTFLAQIRNEWRGRDVRPFSGQGTPHPNERLEYVPPTGSYKLFLSPQVGYTLSPQWQLSLLGDLPLYQVYNEQQLGTSYSLLLMLAYQWED